MATFLLVHGAWHGGWCWQRVATALQAKGHKVYAPSLTGLADRSHLLSNSINLDTHIADIVNLFKWEDLKDACLVAHSYGGWPTSGALEHIGDRESGKERVAELHCEVGGLLELDGDAAGALASYGDFVKLFPADGRAALARERIRAIGQTHRTASAPGDAAVPTPRTTTATAS